MKYDTAVLYALAAIATSVHAAPGTPVQARDFTAGDPLVACMQKSGFPRWPIGGDASKEQAQLKACFPRRSITTARDLESIDPRDTSDPELQSRDFSDPINAIGGLGDKIRVLGGKIMGIDQKAECQEKNGAPIKLHDEFVWPEDVASVAEGVGKMCDRAMDIIDTTGIHKDGGIGYAHELMKNAFDEQSNFLHKGRELLLTMTINYTPGQQPR